MEKYLRIALWIGIPSIILIIALIVVIQVVSSERRKKMYSSIEATLNVLVARDPEKNSLEKVFCEDYDYILNLDYKRIYIMIVPNSPSGEICVNSATAWQLRFSIMDEGGQFVERIDKLMRLDPPYVEGKENQKLYIIYPSARSMLKYINECEMEFVHPTTDVYGTHLIMYTELDAKKETIEL